MVKTTTTAIAENANVVYIIAKVDQVPPSAFLKSNSISLKSESFNLFKTILLSFFTLSIFSDLKASKSL